jgi:hypothetical protein
MNNIAQQTTSSSHESEYPDDSTSIEANEEYVDKREDVDLSSYPQASDIGFKVEEDPSILANSESNDYRIYPEPRDNAFSFLLPYKSWIGSKGMLTKISSPTESLLNELIEIVQVEGPILQSYLMRRHYKAAGGSSLSAQTETIYIAQIKRLIDRQYLVADEEIISDTLKVVSIRTPDQPKVTTRVRGPRDLYEMPPLEIAMIMKNTLQSNSKLINGSDREMFFRQVLLLLDFTKLTSKADEHLNRIYTTYNHLIKGDN